MMERIKIKPLPEVMEDVLLFVEQSLEGYPVSKKSMLQIGIIVDEIFSNIALYSSATEAEVICDVTDDLLTMGFLDNGVPYDPTKREKPDITLNAEERNIGGLGIFMVKGMVSSMEYEYKDGHNALTICKRL